MPSPQSDWPTPGYNVIIWCKIFAVTCSPSYMYSA